MHRHLCGESVFTAWCQARSHATALVTCTYFHYFRSGLFFCRILFQVIFSVLFLFMLSPRRSQHRLVLLFPVAPRIRAYAHPYVFCLTSRSSRRRKQLRGFIFLLLHFGLLIVAFGLLITIFVKNRLSSAPHALPRRTSTYFTWSESGGVWWKREARQH